MQRKAGSSTVRASVFQTQDWQGERYATTIATAITISVARVISPPLILAVSTDARSAASAAPPRPGAGFRLGGGKGPRRASPDRPCRAAARAAALDSGQYPDRDPRRFRPDGSRRWRSPTWNAASHDSVRGFRLSTSVFVEDTGDIGAHDRADPQMAESGQDGALEKARVHRRVGRLPPRRVPFHMLGGERL